MKGERNEKDHLYDFYNYNGLHGISIIGCSCSGTYSGMEMVSGDKDS
jgi:hypothetical protein